MSKKEANISSKSALNSHFVTIFTQDYSRFVAPPSSQLQKVICAAWAKKPDKDPTGEKVKQNVNKLS